MIDKKKILQKKKALKNESNTFALIGVHVLLAVIDILMMKYLSWAPFLFILIGVLSVVVTILCACYISTSKGLYFVSEIVMAAIWYLGINILCAGSPWCQLGGVTFCIIGFITHLIGQMLIVGTVEIYKNKKKS